MDDSLTLPDILGVLRRQARLIGLVAALLLVAALAYIFTVTPIYRATALVLFDPSQANLLSSDQSPAVSASAEVTRIESEVEIMQSQATALALVDRANLVADPEFGPRLSTSQRLLQAMGFGGTTAPAGDREVQRVLERVLKAREVRREGLTNVISVSFRSESPARAAELANAFARTHIARQVEARVGASLAARDVLQAQAVRAQQALATVEGRLDSFVDDNLERLEAESGSPELRALRAQLDDAERARLLSQGASDQAKSALATRDWDELAASLEDEALASLNAQRADLERQLAVAEAGSQAEIQLRAELAGVEQSLVDSSRAAVESLDATVAELQTESASFRDDIREELLDGELSSATVAELFSLQQEASIARDQNQTLLSRLRELEAQASVQLADSRIVSEALAPSSPSAPNRKLILAAALAAGLGLGVALAFANEFLIGGVTSAGQLASLTQTEVGAVVPVLPRQDHGTSVADGFLTAPLSSFSESIRKLRASIDEARYPRGGAGDGLVITVCSSLPGEGKSTLALALARAYATSGKHVVLVDGDLRKPSIHRYLGVEPQGGLLDYLISDEAEPDVAGLVARDPLSPCVAILGQGRSGVPTDQLAASTRMERLILRLRGAFDVVVVDSPPLGPVVDGRYLARLADVVPLVVRHASTPQTELRESVSLLRRFASPDTPVITVLNQAAGWSPRSRYAYGGYYEEPAA